MKQILSEKDKMEIFQNVVKGQYSRDVVYGELDDIMERLLGVKGFSGIRYSLTTQQIQIILNTMLKLEEKASK